MRINARKWLTLGRLDRALKWVKEMSGTPLAGNVAFVTGGSKGIGRAICLGLAEAGAAVALTGRSAGDGPGTVDATATEIRDTGGQALGLICDSRQSEEVQCAISQTVASFGRLDVLVNNAGLFFPGSDVVEMDLEKWRETIDTHITGSFLCARYAIPHMVAGGGGSIINMSSAAGDSSHDSTGNVGYAVAKAGLEQLTRGLARELKRDNIAVNAIRPMSLLSEGSLQNSDWVGDYRERTRRPAAPNALSDEDRIKLFSPASAINPSIVYLAQRRIEFTGHVVRRTDFNGQEFSTTTVDES